MTSKSNQEQVANNIPAECNSEPQTDSESRSDEPSSQSQLQARVDDPAFSDQGQPPLLKPKNAMDTSGHLLRRNR